MNDSTLPNRPRRFRLPLVLFCPAIGVFTAMLPSRLAAAEPRPKVLFIMSDDLNNSLSSRQRSRRQKTSVARPIDSNVGIP